jgi:5-methylcytosine-specific restriction enzyme subunit McrC
MNASQQYALVEGGVPVSLTELDERTVNLEVREQWRKLLAARAARLQRDLGLRETPLVVTEGDNGPSLRTTGIAGTVRLGRHELDIAPKHVSDVASSNWHRSLIVMIERAARRKVDFSLSDRLDLGRGTFADYFAFSFAVALDHATRREPVRLYSTRRETSPVLRGRLLVADQLRSSLTSPHQLTCEVDRLDADNPINTLLCWAGRRLLTFARDGRVRRLLSHQLGKLPDVITSRPPLGLRATLPRQFAHYSTAVELAVALIRAEGPHPESAAEGGAGFVVGTERLFEQFIERSLASIAATTAWEVVPQLRELFAEPNRGNAGRAFYSKPDNVVQVGAATKLVIDAKYKRFEDATEERVGSRPTNADLYQLAAASVAHKCTKALLVYPRSETKRETMDSPIRWWRVDGWGVGALQIGVTAVDLDVLGQSGGVQEFDQSLKQRVGEALT